MAVNINFLAGREKNVNNVPLQQGKVLFAIDQENNGDFIGYIYYDYYSPELKKVMRVSMGSGGGSTANNPILSIADTLGNIGDEVATANVTKATLQLPKIIEAEYFGAHTNFLLSDIASITKPHSRLYSNGLLMFDPAAITKQGWLRIQPGNDKISTLELGMADSETENGISNLNRIVARLYNAEGEIAKEAILLDLNGTTTFPGPVYSSLFVGNLEGNASSATNAENDESGNNIAFNYLTTIEDNTLSASNYLVDLITGNGRVAKTWEIPAASEETTGLITATSQTLAGWKTLQGYLIFPWMTTEDTVCQEDLIFQTTNRYSYDYKKTGLTGYFSYFEDFWQITGHQNTENTGYLEVSVGNTGEESIYFTRYTLDANQNPLLSEIITLMDKDAGSVLRRLTIIDDDATTVAANLDYGLYVDEETGLYGNLYTSGSVRFDSGGEKNSIFYIVPDKELGIKFPTVDPLGECAKYIDIKIPYYAYLKSLYLQENLEVYGMTLLGDTLITKNILPDMNDTYNIGRGLPEEGPDDNYYLNSFIRNMYSNRIIVQGPIEEKEGIQAESTNPHILFRQNDEGSTNDPAYLYYTNYYQGDSYIGYHGLRLTGYTRPWLDIDGAIYSRYDNNRYISILADGYSSELLLTNCGPLLEGNLQQLKVDDNSTRLYLQREQDKQYIELNTSDLGSSNRIYSNRTWGVKTSYFMSEVTDGDASIMNQATDETFVYLKSSQGKSNLINIQSDTQSYINLQNDTEFGINLLVQQSDSNYFNLYNDSTCGYNFTSYFYSSMFSSIFSRDDYKLNILLPSGNTYGKMIISEYEGSFLALSAQNNDTYLDLKAPSGRSAYLHMSNGDNYWNIFTTSNSSNDYPGALQFKLNNADYSRIIFANDTNSGIELYGNEPYIDFHFSRSDKDYTSRIKAMEPFSTLVEGALYLHGQIIIPDNNETAISSAGAGSLLVGHPTDKHLAIDNYSISAKSGTSLSTLLYLNRNGGRVAIGEGGLSIAQEDVDNTYKLYVGGTAYFDNNVDFNQNVNIASKLYVDEDVEIQGDLNLFSNLNIRGNILPKENALFNLGSQNYIWKNIYGENIYGRLYGTADIALIAEKIRNSFTIKLNNNTYNYDGSRPLSFQFYAPQVGAEQDQYVLYWDNGVPQWGDPNWVVPEPDPSDSGYVRKIGDIMSGLLTLNAGARFGIGVTLKGVSNSVLDIQGLSNTAETTLRLRASEKSQYTGYADITYDTQHHNFITVSRAMCIIDSDVTYPGQLRLINNINSKGVYLYNTGTTCNFSVTASNNPFSYDPTNDKKAMSINLTTGIVDCQYGLRGAVWNDYAEYRESDELEPGRCVYEVGDDSLTRTTKRLMPGCNIVSDTFGFAQGETDKAKTPIATAGRVLAYTFEDRNSFEPGDAVCSGPNGTVSKMTREEIREWPDRIVGTVSCVPTYEYWGNDNEVKVNGRIWVKVK